MDRPDAARRRRSRSSELVTQPTLPAVTPPPATLSEALTDTLRDFLDTHAVSQREFAKQLGVTQGAVSYLLAKKRRANVLDFYARLAGVLGVSLSGLILELEQRMAADARVVHGGAPEPPDPLLSSTPPDAIYFSHRLQHRAVIEKLLYEVIARLREVEAAPPPAEVSVDGYEAALGPALAVREVAAPFHGPVPAPRRVSETP